MSKPKEVSFEQVLSKYNIIGLAIAVAIGIAGQEMLFSLSNDIVIPFLGLITRLSFFRKYNFDFRKFFSSLLTFLIVTAIIVALLFTVLKPMVTADIQRSEKKESDIVLYNSNVQLTS